MSRYAVVGFLGVVDGRTDEATIEVDTLDEAFDRIRDLDAARPDWRALTLIHSEDFPVVMQDAQQQGRPPAARIRPAAPMGDQSTPRRFWCQQGTLYTLVEAADEAAARAKAAHAFRHPQRNHEGLVIREATDADLETWERLGQLKAWLDAGGAEVLTDG